MKADIYLAFYDYSSGLGWWRSLLIKILTLNKVNHVGLVFSLPFANITPMVMDGSPTRLMTEFIIEQKGGICLYKKYMGSYDICLEQIKKIADEHPISTWYKVLFWYVIGRWFGVNTSNCVTFAVDWLNKNLGYKFKNRHIPHLLMQEVQHDYSNDWW